MAEVLYQSLSDYVALTVLHGLVEESTHEWWRGEGAPDPAVVRCRSLEICMYLLGEGLMRVGALSNSAADSVDFLEWSGDAEELMGRISREWDHLMSLEHFEPCWLRGTPAGLCAGGQLSR
ncbi:hypothetical protein [Nocardia sp. NBC_00511]|uniref:hypothetical protein n=1 Tax=Nocardia sp. NBC_00511 TaxID=2903591 RepID=UPI0030E23AD3